MSIAIDIEERNGAEWPPELSDYKDFGYSEATGDWFPPSETMPLGGELTYKLAYKKWLSIEQYLSWFVVYKNGTSVFRSHNWITDADKLPDEYVETVTREEAIAETLNEIRRVMQASA